MIEGFNPEDKWWSHEEIDALTTSSGSQSLLEGTMNVRSGFSDGKPLCPGDMWRLQVADSIRWYGVVQDVRRFYLPAGKSVDVVTVCLLEHVHQDLILPIPCTGTSTSRQRVLSLTPNYVNSKSATHRGYCEFVDCSDLMQKTPEGGSLAVYGGEKPRVFFVLYGLVTADSNKTMISVAEAIQAEDEAEGWATWMADVIRLAPVVKAGDCNPSSQFCQDVFQFREIAPAPAEAQPKKKRKNKKNSSPTTGTDQELLVLVAPMPLRFTETVVQQVANEEPQSYKAAPGRSKIRPARSGTCERCYLLCDATNKNAPAETLKR